MSEFLSGAIMICTFMIGLFFLKFWRRTRERFFAKFAIAFWLLCIERWVFWYIDFETANWTWVYLFRLAAFVIIWVAVFDLNRPRKRIHGEIHPH